MSDATRIPPQEDPVTAWAQEVVAGEVVAGPKIRAVAARHPRNLD